MVRSFMAGDQAPFTPLFEIVGKGFILSPIQIGATGVKTGVTTGCISTVIVTVSTAHCPVEGVKL